MYAEGGWRKALTAHQTESSPFKKKNPWLCCAGSCFALCFLASLCVCVCDSHSHESAQTSGLVPLLPPHLLLPGEVREDRGSEERLAEDICQAFCWLASTTRCLEAHLQPCPSPFLFPAGSSSSKTSLISPGAGTRAFNGSLLKQTL